MKFLESVLCIFFEKSPENAKEGESVKGLGQVFGEGQFPLHVTSERTQATRVLDGRTVSVTVMVSENGTLRSVIKLYDDKHSSYYLPDEMLDKIIMDGEVISTFHFVAKGRSFIPLESKNKTML